MAEALQLLADFTSCPQCGWYLCSSILPCGHVFCRKCLRHALDSQRLDLTCPSCFGHTPVKQDDTVREVIEQLSKDLILEEMVKEQVGRSLEVTCISCRKKQATKACLDCSEHYCDGCSVAHGRMGIAKDHVQMDLPRGSDVDVRKRALSSGPIVSPTSVIRSLTSSTLPDASLKDESSKTKGPTTRSTPAPEDDSDSLPADIFFQNFSSNRPNSGSVEEFLFKQARAYENRFYVLEDAAKTLDTTIAQLQEVKNTLKKQQNVLKKYAANLYRPDEGLASIARAILPRLKCILADCRPPPEESLSTLRQDVWRLVEFYTKPGIPFDPLTAIPKPNFKITPISPDDVNSSEPSISSLLTTPDGRLVMAHHSNASVKVAELTNPETTTQCLHLEAKPWGLALLRNGNVVVTSSERTIYFINASRPLAVASQFPTARQYWGVGVLAGGGNYNEKLLLSCVKDSDGPASIDVLTLDGVALRTVIDNSKLGSLVSPRYLSIHSEKILISDKTASVVFSADLETGQVSSALTHPKLASPMQVITDPKGNSYVASFDGKGVLVLTTTGQWRRLLERESLPQKEGSCVNPSAVCAVSWGLIVAWNDPEGQCCVEGYDLTQ